eukprot:1036721-Karenia_brevis.AAC.1
MPRPPETGKAVDQQWHERQNLDKPGHNQHPAGKAVDQQRHDDKVKAEEKMEAMPRPPEVEVGDQSASARPLGMGPQPVKGGYKSLVNGPTPDG